MSICKQPPASGAISFLTIRTGRHGEDLLVRHVEVLRLAVRETRRRAPFWIEAMAVLPDVVHAIWALPGGEADFSARITMLRDQFSRMMAPTAGQTGQPDEGIWQGPFQEREIRGQSEFIRYRDMIHLSPVRAGLCAAPEDWLHSSVHRERFRQSAQGPARKALSAAPRPVQLPSAYAEAE